MKRVNAIFILCLIGLGLTACGGGSSSSSAPPTLPANPQDVLKSQPQDSTPSSPQQITQTDDQKTTVSEVKEPKIKQSKAHKSDAHKSNPLKKNSGIPNKQSERKHQKSFAKASPQTAKTSSKDKVLKTNPKKQKQVIIKQFNCGYKASRELTVSLENAAKDGAFDSLTSSEGIYRLMLNDLNAEIDVKVLKQGIFTLLDHTKASLTKDHLDVVVFQDGRVSLQLLHGAVKANTLKFYAQEEVDYTLTDTELQLAKQGALAACGTLDTEQLKQNAKQGKRLVGTEKHSYQLSLPVTIASPAELKKSLATRLQACNTPISIHLLDDNNDVITAIERQQGKYHLQTEDKTELTDIKLTEAFLAEAKKEAQYHNLKTKKQKDQVWELAFFGNANEFSTLEMRLHDENPTENWDAKACNLSAVDLAVIAETALQKVNQYVLSVPLMLSDQTLPSLKQHFGIIDRLDLGGAEQNPLLLDSPLEVDWAYIYMLNSPETAINLQFTDYALDVLNNNRLLIKSNLNPAKMDWIDWSNQIGWVTPEVQWHLSLGWLAEVTKENPGKQEWQVFNSQKQETLNPQKIHFNQANQLLLFKTQFGDVPQQSFLEGIYNPDQL